MRRAKIKRGAATTDIPGGMTTAPENPYLRDAVMTATPEQLHLMLYDGAIRFCMQARDALERKEYDTSYDKLTRAQNIILEMESALRHDVNPGLSKRMAAVYNFLYRKLIEANVQRKTEAIDDALKVLRIERETWRMLVEKVSRVREGSGNTDERAARDGRIEPASTTISVEG
ncbi:MAG: flagellar export chaperone FliS [Planctomycetota bacterium]